MVTRVTFFSSVIQIQRLNVSREKTLGWMTVVAQTYRVTSVVIETRTVFSLLPSFSCCRYLSLSLIFPLTIILNCRFRFFLKAEKHQFSNSSLRTGKIGTRVTALGRSMSQRKWLTCSRFHSMHPNCTVPRRWQPSTTWWTMALARWRYFHVCLSLSVRVFIRPLYGSV